MNTNPPAVWFLAIRTGTGTDHFTIRLSDSLTNRGIRNSITWLPLRAEFLPWTVPIPRPPLWANIAHINTWLHPRFIPCDMSILATLHHSVHDQTHVTSKPLLRKIYHKYWIAPNETNILKRANRVSAVSNFVAESAKLQLLNIPIEVIYNGLDVTQFCPNRRTRNEQRPFRLLYIGSWSKRKGVDLLPQIMEKLGAGYELHFTGGSPVTHRKQEYLPNMKNVGILRTDEVIKAMNEADAFLFPSRSEGFGLVAAEAMACGLPVICSNISSLPEVVENGISGILCPSDNVDAFVAEIQKLAMNPGLRAEMADQGRLRALSMFDQKIQVDKYISMYHRMEKENLPHVRRKRK